MSILSSNGYSMENNNDSNLNHLQETDEQFLDRIDKLKEEVVGATEVHKNGVTFYRKSGIFIAAITDAEMNKYNKLKEELIERVGNVLKHGAELDDDGNYISMNDGKKITGEEVKKYRKFMRQKHPPQIDFQKRKNRHDQMSDKEFMSMMNRSNVR
jgi:hypothetical protein